jgi:hypothetical protein
MGRACDYCDEGNVAVDGWHYFKDWDLGLDYRVPCATNPPVEAAYD